MNPRIISSKNRLPGGRVDHYRPIFCEPFPISRPRPDTLVILGGVLDYHYVSSKHAVIREINEHRHLGFIPRLRRDVLEMHERSLVIDALRSDGCSVGGVVFTTNVPLVRLPITPTVCIETLVR